MIHTSTGAVQEVGYFPASPCIFSRFVETVRKYRNKDYKNPPLGVFRPHRLFRIYTIEEEK